MSSKAALLCFISAGFVTAFKLLYKESIDTVNRPLIKHPILQAATMASQPRRYFQQ